MSEYLNTYNYCYNKVFKQADKVILASLKDSFKKEINYNYFENNASKRINIYKNYILKKVTANHSASLKLFNSRYSYHTKNVLDNTINGILKDEFAREYKDSNFKNYNYKIFIADIAKLESLRVISSTVEVNSKLYSNMYELNKFNGFKLIKLTDDPELLKLNNQLHEEIYGKEEPQIATMNYTLENQKKIKKTTISKELEELNNYLRLFTEEDKILLLNICYNNIPAIPITEFAKINYITNDLFNEDFLLNKNTSNSTFYNKLNKGPSYYSTQNSKDNLFSLIRKLESLKKLNLKSTLKILQNIVIKL